MAVSPEQLRSLRFDEGLRGYDKRQVDKVVARVADLVEDLQNRLREAESRLAAAEARANERPPAPRAGHEAAELDEQLRRTLILAQRTADAAVKEAREDAALIRSEAEAEAEAILAGARGRADELASDAEQRHADALAQAEAERSRLVAEARQQCEDRIAAVQAELVTTHEVQRDELVGQVGRLTEIRDVLADDVELLESHLSRRRQDIRGALDELTALLEDPAKLQGAPPPELHPVEAPHPGQFEPVTLDIAAMTALLGPEVEVEVEGNDDTDGIVAGNEAGPEDDDAPDSGGGPPTELHEVVVADESPGGDGPEAWPGLAPIPDGPVEEPARPAWADAVPPAPLADQSDPFLDELRRASAGTGDDDDVAAMERFFSESDEDRRSGWFRRKA